MEKDLKFTGKKIASVTSTSDKSRGQGYINESTVLSLYRTKRGAFVCERATCLVWDDERDIYEGAICNSVDTIIAFFGTDWLAKALYDQAAIEAVEVIA